MSKPYDWMIFGQYRGVIDDRYEQSAGVSSRRSTDAADTFPIVYAEEDPQLVIEKQLELRRRIQRYTTPLVDRVVN